MKNRKEVTFTVNKEDVRKLAANAVNHILERFKYHYMKDVNKIAESLTFEKGSKVIKDIETMLESCHVMAHELNDIAPLLQEITEKIQKEED